MLVPLCNWYLPFVECKTKNQNSSLAKMKLLAVSSVIVTFCLLPVVDCASVSLSSSQLSLEGNARIRFDGAREVVWSGLTDGKYIRFRDFLSSVYLVVRTCDIFCFFFSLVLEFGYCSMVSWLFLFSLIYVIYEFNRFLHRGWVLFHKSSRTQDFVHFC